MDAVEVRLECLRLAKDRGGDAQDVVNIAREWADFAMSRNDAKVIRAVHEFAEKIAN